MPRPNTTIWELASCDACQLTLFDWEDELLQIAGAVDISHSLEPTRSVVEGPYDTSLEKG